MRPHSSLALALWALLALVHPGAAAHIHTPDAVDGALNSRSARPVAPLLQHIHGLGFAPDGSRLLVSSHTGLIAYRAGQGWVEVDGPVHDFAGFTMAERAIYASGHPPPGSPLPNPLGLVKSADLGATWLAVALGGEADLHMLAAGFRSGALYLWSERPYSLLPAPGLHLSRDDGKSWRRAATEGFAGEPFALAAHPNDANIIAVASSRGLFLSRDGGDRFRRLDGRAVTALAFDLDGARLLYAPAVRRELVRAKLDGRSRLVVRLPPLGVDYPTHLAQDPSNLRRLAIGTDRRHVYLTADEGRTWRIIARDGDIP